MEGKQFVGRLAGQTCKADRHTRETATAASERERMATPRCDGWISPGARDLGARS